MKLLNRSGLSIRPRQPLWDWLSAFGDERLPSLEEMRSEATLYLIDEVEEEQDFVDAIDQYWQAIFRNELEAWVEEGEHWPDPLTPELFEQWFELDVQLVSFDLSKEPLMRASALF